MGKETQYKKSNITGKLLIANQKGEFVNIDYSGFPQVEDTEIVTVVPKGEDFEINIFHNPSGSSYGITLSKQSLNQLRKILNK
jgi:hypothetical protein